MSQGYKETRLSSRETDGLHSRPSSTMDLSFYVLVVLLLRLSLLDK